MNRLFSDIAIFVLCFSVFLACNKKDDDKSKDDQNSGSLVIPPDLATEIKGKFPLLGDTEVPEADANAGSIETQALLEDVDPCSTTDSYSNQMEPFDCLDHYGGTFQRMFTFDPASIYFSTFIIDIISQMISGEGNVTFNGPATLEFPFLKDFDDENPLSLEASQTFTSNGVYSISQEADDETISFKIKNAKGGFTENSLAVAFNVELYPDEHMNDDPEIYARFIFFGDKEDGLKVRFARVEYEVDNKSELLKDNFDDSTPDGYHKNGGQMKLTVDSDDNYDYKAVSGSGSDSMFSLAMSGTFDKLLIRKRFSSGTDSAEQFWITKYSEKRHNFSDLGINDSTESFCVTSTGEFTFDSDDSVCFGNSIKDEIEDHFESIAPSSDEMSTVSAKNMLNFFSDEDLPSEMSTLEVDW